MARRRIMKLREPGGISVLTHVARSSLPLVILLTLMGCPGGSTGPPEPPPEAGVISLSAGDEQMARVGMPVPVRPAVRVTSDDGDPVPGATVRFRVISGGGSLAGETAVTDANGVATVGNWTLGTEVGPQSMRAAISGLFPYIFSATAEVGPPSAMVGTAGDGDLGTVELEARILPRVRVTDEFQNPAAAIGVRFEIVGGGGTVTGADQATDENGFAEVGGWMFGPNPGTNQLRAVIPDSPGVTAVSFSVETVLPVPATLVLAAGASQGVAVGEDLMVAPTAQVVDAADNPVENITVDFTVDAGGGTITGPSGQTDADGLASVGSWTMGPTVVENRLAASLPGFPGVTPITFLGFPALPGGYNIEFRHQDPLTAAETAAFATAKAFWESVIIDEFPDISFADNIVPANTCSSVSPFGFEHPRLDQGDLDELLIFTQRLDIPVGGVIAVAGPCANRNLQGFQTPFTALGVLTLDPDLSEVADQQGLLDDVLIHEMGHILGFGANWWFLGNPVNPSRPASPGADTHFDGETARAAFARAGGAAYVGGLPVPVDNTALAGSADGHWRESVLATEMMTSEVVGGVNPFSEVSVGAMHDLLYTVDPSAAEAYALPVGPAATGGISGRGFDMRGDTWSSPLFFIGGPGGPVAAPRTLGWPGEVGSELTRSYVFRWKR